MELVVVEWFDVTKISNDEDFDEKKDVNDRLSDMKTVGWLFQQSDKVILLVQEFNDDKSPRDWVTIPRVLITKMDIVEKKKED